MGTKSPSKYMSLERLKELKNNYYSNLDKGIDYNPSEVDSLIWEKETKKSENAYNKMLIDQVKFENRKLLDAGLKICNCCKKVKNISDYSPRSKLNNHPRSYCKTCRSEKTKQYKSLPF